MLLIPKQPWERPEHPRREVRVSLSGHSPEAPGALQFDGEADDVRQVREILLHQASGAWGAFIEVETTAVHMLVAMDGPAMARFQPECLEGGGLFQSASAELQARLTRIADLASLLFTETLPRLPSFDDEARAQLVERLRLILALYDAACAAPECPDDAVATLNIMLRERLARQGVDGERLRHILEEACAFLGVVLLGIPQSGSQAAALLRRIDPHGEPVVTDLHAMRAALRAIWFSTPGVDDPDRR